MSIKKLYYSLNEKEFNEYLNKIKEDSNCKYYFNNQYFYLANSEINNELLKLHKAQLDLDYLITSFKDYEIAMIKQSCLLDEIQSTNSTENIYSTKSDIFSVLKDVKGIKDKKIVSIINSYNAIDQIPTYTSLASIRNAYDLLMKDAYESNKDKPDGNLFRKEPVYVTNGIKKIHSGFYPEEEIIKGMNEFLDVYNDSNMDIYEKIVLSHFLIETIHPFYDGNGRFGRYLMTCDLYKEEHTMFAYVLATSINESKKKYYDALKIARDIHSFGCINDYVLTMLEILNNGISKFITSLKEKQQLLNIKCDYSLTNAEYKIYECLHEGSVLTYYGISNEDIMNITNVSKRTLMNTLKKFREFDLLDDIKMGKVTYHKLKS